MRKKSCKGKTFEKQNRARGTLGENVEQMLSIYVFTFDV